MTPRRPNCSTHLQTVNMGDDRPLWEILGLAVPDHSAWKQLRIGELKTLLALAVGDEEADQELAMDSITSPTSRPRAGWSIAALKAC